MRIVRKLFAVTGFLVCVFFLFADPGIPDKEAAGYYNNGIGFYGDNDFDSAIKEFSKAIALFPEYVDAYIGRGNSYDNKGNSEKALQDYLEASKRDGQFAIFTHGYECVERLDSYDEGIVSLSESINLGINTLLAYCIRGNAYLGKKEFDTAILNYNEALKLNPNFFQAYFNRGTAYFEKEDFDAAIENYEKAAEVCPDFIRSFYCLGILYKLKGDLQKSEEMFRIYRNSNPENYI
jgi:tetratricopeptide (TPR) repeat protein